MASSLVVAVAYRAFQAAASHAFQAAASSLEEASACQVGSHIQGLRSRKGCACDVDVGNVRLLFVALSRGNNTCESIAEG